MSSSRDSSCSRDQNCSEESKPVANFLELLVGDHHDDDDPDYDPNGDDDNDGITAPKMEKKIKTRQGIAAPKSEVKIKSKPNAMKRGAYNKISLDDKRKIVEFARNSTPTETSKKFGIKRTTVIHFMTLDLKKPGNKKGGGRPITYPPEVEQQIIKWVSDFQRQQNIVPYESFIEEARKLIRIHNPDFEGTRGWAVRFCKRHQIGLGQNITTEKISAGKKSKLFVCGVDKSTISEISKCPLSGIDELPICETANHSVCEVDEIDKQSVFKVEKHSMEEIDKHSISEVDKHTVSEKERLLTPVSETVNSYQNCPEESNPTPDSLDGYNSNDGNNDGITAPKHLADGYNSNYGENDGIMAPKKEFNITITRGMERGAYKKLSLNDKREIVEFARKSTPRTAEKLFGIPRTTVIHWMQLDLENCQPGNKKGAGHPTSCPPEVEQQLVKWVKELRHQQKQVPFKNLVKEACKLISTYKPDFEGSRGWGIRFCERHKLCFDGKGNIIEKIPVCETAKDLSSEPDKPSVGGKKKLSVSISETVKSYESSVKRRSMGTRRDAKNKETEEDKESKDNRAIRTRLSTGSIHMNGTTTIAVAKEIENNCKLLTKDSPSGVRKKKLGVVEPASSSAPPPKKRKIGRNDGTGEDNRNDYFCWLCHKEGTVVCCELCPRVYHLKCLDLDADLPKEWVCPECEQIMRAECVDTRSQAMCIISVDTLCSLLGFALERMKHQGTEPFMNPVDQSSVQHYSDYVYNPMDLAMLEKNIKKKMYGCTEAFLADAKWILHNCIIFNGTHHKLTASAKMIIKICKHEMAEIELCPDCYWNSCVRKNDEWFTELCRTPHNLAWAKLKGYPFWPAKVLREIDKQVDVRFFGAHDRSLLPTSQVFLLSKNIPTPAKNKKGGFDYSMEELELHIKKLEQKYGKYEYAPFRCPYDSKNVYKEGKFKVSPKRRISRNNSHKFGTASARSNFKDSLMKQRQKNNLSTDSKSTEKQTILSKTASAVRNKYNSIITTRRNSSLSSSVENSPVKGDNKSIVLNIPTVTEGTSETPAESLSSPVDPKSASDILLRLKTRLQGKLKEPVDSKPEVPSESAEIQSDKKTDTVEIKGDNSGDTVEIRGDNSSDATKDEKIKTESLSDKDIVKKTESVINKDIKVEKLERVSGRTRSRSETTISVLESIQKKIATIEGGDETVNKTDNMSEEKSDKDIVSETAVPDKGCDQIPVSEKTEILNENKNEVNNDKALSSPIMEKNTVQEKLTPSKKDYLSKLQETIKKGKENLGITDDADELEDEISSSSEEEDDDDDEEDEDEETDDDETDEGEEDVEMDDENKKINDATENSQDKSSTISESEKNSNCDKDVPSKSKTVIEREYEMVTKDVLDETTGEITTVKERIVPEPMETQEDDTCLMMEVETESDTDKLVIDTEDDSKTLSPSPRKPIVDRTISPPPESTADRTISPSPSKSTVDKTVTPTQCKDSSPPPSEIRSKANEAKSQPSKEKSPVLESASTSPKIISSTPKTKEIDQISSQTELRSDFFQSAVEKTLKQKPPMVVSNSINNLKKKTLVTKVISLGPTKPPVSSDVNTVTSVSASVNSNVNCSVNSDNTSVTSSVNTSVNSVNTTVTSSVNKPSISDTSATSSSTKTDDSRSTLITDFTQKVMGPIQTAFSDFFSEVLEQERQKIKEEMEKTTEKIVEEKKKEKTPEEKSEIEKKRWEYTQQFAELKYNFRLTCLEMKSSWESEKGRLVDEIKEMMKKEKETAINETKKKQWCAKCGKEAIFYCCWNTSYCDYPCQQAHWPSHMATCMQQATNENDANKSQHAATSQSNQPSNQNTHTINRPNVPQPPTKSQMELEQEEFQRRQQMQRAEEQQHQQFNVQPNGGYMPMHTSPPGVMHNIHRQQDSPPSRKKNSIWSDMDMNNAVAAVNYGGMSINKASKVYNVPRNKITERVSKTSPALNQPQMMPPGNGPPNPQLQLQYVQPPQPMSIPPSVQTFSTPPQMRMPTSQPVLTSMINSQPAQNNSILFPIQLRPTQPPMNIPPNMMQQPGQLLISQGAQPPRQSPNMMPRASLPFHGRF